MRTIAPTSRDIARFQAKLLTNGDCLEWQGFKEAAGYGKFSMNFGGKWSAVRAHRFSYVVAHGSIPEGMEIDHICHNRACVRPSHLRITTRKQNSENHSGPTVTNRSGVRGVHWDPGHKKWRAMVQHAGKTYRVGRFERIEDAEAAIVAKRNELFTHNDMDRKAVA